ncbi:MAG: redoxin domain-containing protein [Ginsengibacter sp.]
MKLLSILSIFIFSFGSANAQGFKVTLEAPQYQEGIAYLIYYFGKNMNVEDSAAVNAKGVAVFQKNEKIKPGVYSIVFPGKNRLYDFLIDKEQSIQIKAPDTSNLLEKTIVTGSKENVLFQNYQKTAAEKGALMQKEIEAFKASASRADSTQHERNYQAINNELNQYREGIITNNSSSMLASLLTAMKEPQVLHPRPQTRKDSIENYQHYKKHFWDGITFMDDRIIRTPFFLPKLERYFREVVSPAPDSTIKDMEYLILLSRSNPEMYKFLLNWLTDEYINPKYMGQDKVFVHLFEKYHSKGLTNWLNEKQLTAISNRAYMVMSNLIGEKAANIEMTNIAGAKSPLYNIKANYTVVAFWDPSCGHCRTEMPRMDSLYKARWKKEGVKIYAVLSEIKEKENWVNFIKEHKMDEWTNVFETEEQRKAVENAKTPSYKQLYDVIQTPTLYLLDNEKRIIAKKLTLEQMDEVLQAKIKNTTADTQ